MSSVCAHRMCTPRASFASTESAAASTRLAPAELPSCTKKSRATFIASGCCVRNSVRRSACAIKIVGAESQLGAAEKGRGPRRVNRPLHEALRIVERRRKRMLWSEAILEREHNRIGGASEVAAKLVLRRVVRVQQEITTSVNKQRVIQRRSTVVGQWNKHAKRRDERVSVAQSECQIERCDTAVLARRTTWHN
jgi:hypothetical protein